MPGLAWAPLEDPPAPRRGARKEGGLFEWMLEAILSLPVPAALFRGRYRSERIPPEAEER